MDPETGEENPNLVYSPAMKRSIDLVLAKEYEGTSPDFCPSGMMDAPRPRLRPLPMAPNRDNEANKVYAVFSQTGVLLGVLTSPVDAAEVIKRLGKGAFMQTCVLNAI